jgi:hypothetical protein
MRVFRKHQERPAPLTTPEVRIWLRPSDETLDADDGSEVDVEGFDAFFDDGCTIPLLEDDEGFVADRIFHCKVAGVKRHGGALQRPALEPGKLVYLQAEPSNSFDPNALKVAAIEGKTLLHVGYVPADLAKALAKHASDGVPALVTKAFSRGGKRVGLRIVGAVDGVTLGFQSIEG